MIEVLRPVAIALGGVFATADATAADVSAGHLRALVQAALVHRVGPRAYVLGEAWAAAQTPESRHRLETLAVLRSFDGRVAASHHSALALRHLPFWQVDASAIHVCRTSGRSSRRRGRLHVHQACPLPLLRSTTTGHLSVSPAVAAVGTAMVDGVEAGVVALDAVLHRGLSTPGDLAAALATVEMVPGATAARAAVALSDGRAESPGETRTRLLLSALPDRPAVVPQQVVRDARGEVVGRCDFVVDARVVVEFDGRAKYGMDGRRPEEDLWAEKLREDRLRTLGYVVVRVVWDDLARPAQVLARVQEALRVADRWPGRTEQTLGLVR